MTENSLQEAEVRLHRLFDGVVKSRSEAIALVYEDRRLSFFDLHLYVDWMAGYFQSINLQAGQRVALLLPNSPKLVIGLFGLWRAGGVAVPLEISKNKLERIIGPALSGVEVIMTTPEYKTLLDQALAENADPPPLTVAVYEDDDNIVTLDKTPRGRRAPDKKPLVESRGPASGAQSSAAVLFEAERRCRECSHEELARAAEVMTARMQLAADDRVLCAAPLSQPDYLGNFLIATLVAGATLVLAETNDWENLAQTLVSERVTVAAGPAALLARLAKNPAAMAALRRYFYTEAVLSPEIGGRLPRQEGLQIEQLTETVTTGVPPRP